MLLANALQFFAADSSLLQILTTSLSDGNGVIASSFYLISVFKIPDIILVVSLCSKHWSQGSLSSASFLIAT